MPGKYSRSSASLRVQGDHFDFDEVSRAIGVAPSTIFRKGSLSGIGKKEYEIDSWILDSQLGDNEPLEAHIRWIAGILPNIDRMRSTRDVPGVEDMDLFCALSPLSTECEVHFPPEVLGLCTKMSCDLELSFVFGSSQTSESIGTTLSNGSPQDGSSGANVSGDAAGGFWKRSSASLSMSFRPDVPGLTALALQLWPEAKPLIDLLSSGGLESEVSIELSTEAAEGESTDAQLRKLGTLLRPNLPVIGRLGHSKLFRAKSRFETNCDWASTRLSWQALDLPLLLTCPLILQAKLL